MGISLIGFVVVAVLGMAGLYLYESSKRSNDVAAYAAILLDVTDPLTVQEQQSIINKFGEFVADTEANTQMEIFVVNTTSTNLLEPLVKGKSLVDIRRLPTGLAVANPEMQKAIWTNTFLLPLKTHLEAAMTGSNSTNSPIIQSIQSVALTLFDPGPNRSKPRKLAVVSDLMQNTPGLSFYGGIPSVQELQKLQEFTQHQVDLTGVQIEMWFLRNKIDPASCDQLLELWTDVFSHQGATVRPSMGVPF